MAAFACATARDTVDPDLPSDPADDDVYQGMVAVETARWWQMGCPDGLDGVCREAEVPRHNVFLSYFYLDPAEVTKLDYQACVAVGACDVPGDPWDAEDMGMLPVTGVTWTDADGYCAWRGKRLPTEAEWERAAGGAMSWIYPWAAGAPDCTRANYRDCWTSGEPQLLPSPSFGAGPSGAFDMAGNAYEWVSDWYSESYYLQEGDDVGLGWNDPTGPTPEDAAVIFKSVRGGAYLSAPEALYTFRRFAFPPDSRDASIGFRCARSASPD